MKWLRALSSALLITACSPMMMTPVDAGTEPVTPTPVPAFSLTDSNASSPTVGQALGPSSFSGKVTGWYFGHAS